jgi:hypothetical protein
MSKIYASFLSYETGINDAFETCLNNIGFYIIQKIREEDLRKDKYILDIDENAEDQKMMEEEIKSKIGISEMILNNKDILMNLEDFYEEDCQFSLLNWACSIHKRFRQQRYSKTGFALDYYENINKDFSNKKNSLNNNAEILIFNILNIFEIFPIKPDDLKSLNFIEKLKEIKKDMKTQNLIIYKKIKNLIKFWKSMIKLFDKHKAYLNSEKNNVNININKKRLRENEETAQKDKNKNRILCGLKENNENFSSNLSIYETDSCELNEVKKKNVSWKTDDLLVDKVEYDPTNAPANPSP